MMAFQISLNTWSPTLHTEFVSFILATCWGSADGIWQTQINGKKMKTVERGYIKCNSGDEYHYCTPVEGEIPRIVISYGFLV